MGLFSKKKEKEEEIKDKTNNELENVQEAFDEACSQHDENEGVRILAAVMAIGKWLRLEKELTHIEIWRQARSLASTIIRDAYGTTEEQHLLSNQIGIDMAKSYFKDNPSNYRGFMKGLGITGAGVELSTEGKGDLITLLYCLNNIVMEYDTEDVYEFYSNAIHTTSVDQLEGQDIYDECEEMGEQMFVAWKEKLLEAFPIPPDA